MSFSEIVTAQVEHSPEAKIEQIFETIRTEIATNPTGLASVRANATAALIFGYNEFQAIRAIVNRQQPPAPIVDISEIPEADKSSVLSPALNTAAGDAVAEAIRLHGATDTFSRALTNIQTAYDMVAELLS